MLNTSSIGPRKFFNIYHSLYNFLACPLQKPIASLFKFLIAGKFIFNNVIVLVLRRLLSNNGALGIIYAFLNDLK